MTLSGVQGCHLVLGHPKTSEVHSIFYDIWGLSSSLPFPPANLGLVPRPAGTNPRDSNYDGLLTKDILFSHSPSHVIPSYLVVVERFSFHGPTEHHCSDPCQTDWPNNDQSLHSGSRAWQSVPPLYVMINVNSDEFHGDLILAPNHRVGVGTIEEKE